MSGCLDGHQPRKRGCSWMSAVRYGSLVSSIAAEQPVRARERAERGDQLVAHPGHEEAGEAALAVRGAERRVAGARQLARGVDELLEHVLDRALRGDRQDGVADGAQRRVERVGHGARR